MDICCIFYLFEENEINYSECLIFCLYGGTGMRNVTNWTIKSWQLQLEVDVNSDPMKHVNIDFWPSDSVKLELYETIFYIDQFRSIFLYCKSLTHV